MPPLNRLHLSESARLRASFAPIELLDPLLVPAATAAFLSTIPLGFMTKLGNGAVSFLPPPNESSSSSSSSSSSGWGEFGVELDEPSEELPSDGDGVTRAEVGGVGEDDLWRLVVWIGWWSDEGGEV